jgi:hypothetical protein
VALGPNRLMLRSAFDFQPRHGNARSVVTWPHDVFGNAVATATFQTMADNLVIDSVTELQLDAAAWPVRFDSAIIVRLSPIANVVKLL